MSHRKAYIAFVQKTKFASATSKLVLMGNRDRHDITMEILRKAASRRKKTELMRDVGLSYLQAKQYLNELEKRGLIHVDEKRSFKTTKKGFEFLEKCSHCPLFMWDQEK